MEGSAARYLVAKRSVDDRALNRCVLRALRSALPDGGPDAPIRVLEVGAGEGTMIQRALEWDVLAYADYTAVDPDRDALGAGSTTLPEWARSRGMTTRAHGESLRIAGPDRRVDVRFRHADLFEYGGEEGPFDLVIANAVLDLVDVRAALPRLWSRLRPGGLFWFTINFDGETIFLPERDSELERHILALYHRSMDARTVDGSTTGRRLFQRLDASGARLLAAGASDWVVHPENGAYPGAEGDFLHHIIDTIDAELAGHPELSGDRFRAWVADRHADVEAGRLVFIAHQLDFAGRAPGG